MGPVTCFFTTLAAGQVVVHQWNAAGEFLTEILDEDQLLQYAQAVANFELDKFLAPYDLASYGRWRALASHVSPAVVARLRPVGGNICSVVEASKRAGSRPTPAERALEAQLAAGRGATGAAVSGSTAAETAPHAGRCFYTPVERLAKRPQADAAKRTAANMDRSEELVTIIDKHCGGDTEQLLGELQFAFLAFLLGQSLTGLLQWRALLTLLFRCVAAPLQAKWQPLYGKALEVLTAQLQPPPPNESQQVGRDLAEGSFPDELLQESFIRHLVPQWIEHVREENGGQVPKALEEPLHNLSQALERLLGWDPAARFQELRSAGDLEGSDEDGPPGTHIDEIKEAARKTGDAAKEWTSGTTTPASQEVSPALREVKSARETLETSVSALKETETPVKQRGNGLTGKSGPAPLHHHQHQRQNAKSAAPVADSTRESLGKEINNASQDMLDDPELERLHAERLAELRAEAERRAAEPAQPLYGSLVEIGEGEFLGSVMKADYAVCHFFHPSFSRCATMDRHLGELAGRYTLTSFLRISAPDAPFFTEKLKVRVLPCVIAFKSGIAVDRITGFEGIPGAGNDFKTEALEDRLALADVLHRPQARLDWEKVERHSTGAVRRGIHSRRTESDEDSDFSD
ncbi:hypothetical protein QBZ16_004571 [Prototheca wickerhamii]|uniref:Uncharacterized protein n=1 Tax=Prototheca wickerhamii TaxID=3111 RepID=A0AAD9IIF0_PROWI|nr:hypothetical protein QBZ16_004571 [Prototheca wickerhamii]